jgi:hypothetical protein
MVSKRLTLGLMLIGGEACAVVPAGLLEGEETRYNPAGESFSLRYDSRGQDLRVWRSADGRAAPHTPAFCFAW